MAGELSAFVVPGGEVARSHALDLRGVGLTEAATPRHANVLIVVGELPRGLAEAAVISYAQMPRPRAVLSVGATEASLPVAPDASASLDQDSLASAVAALRRRFAEGAFDPLAEAYEAAALESETEYACPMHPEVVQDEPGTCPKCGMELVAQEAGGGGESGGHAHSPHEGHDHDSRDSGESHEGHDSLPEATGEKEETGGEEGTGGDGDQIPGPVAGEDFMSMVEMTEGTPRGSDGLQMEWFRAPYGPLFPGLPGGLTLDFTLDGDTVVRVESGSVAGWKDGALLGPADSLARRAGSLDPLSPVSCRLLARRAVESAAALEVDEETALARLAALERERAAGHLGWLASFGHIIGYDWLSKRAGEMQLALLAGDGPGVSGLRERTLGLEHRVERTPLFRRRLSGVAELPERDVREGAAGPVARASGIGYDVRREEEAYLMLGFEPVVRSGGDVLDRFRLRLAEASQSLKLVESAGDPAPDVSGDARLEDASGSGSATVETPRGAAALDVTLEGGSVVYASLRIPSEAHLRLVESVALQCEVGDAVVGVASLDLSPWGIASEGSG
jgi:Ni,Fe-hydrogenase III large subunit